ncbi:MAG: hypothetical protein IMY80_04365 [Chloroflexi bacterium]|nr:hypothetical protein [Chloroflexota bacterium]
MGNPTALVQSPPYPGEFSALYEELSTNLSNRENELRADWDGVHAPVIYAATLLSASSNNGSKLLDPTFRAGNRLIINRLASLGIQGIVLQINYPLLTSSFTTDAPAYLMAFGEIADEIRALSLKVIVEHNVLLPGYSLLDPASYYSTLDKKRFGQENYAEVRDIVEQVNPDYLSLVTEPGTVESAIKLQMSVTEWSVYVAEIVNQLSIDVPESTTKLGAGSGTWETPDFVTNFASIEGLDFIDIHSYPLTNNFTDYLKLMETWPALVRTINTSLEIISSETWLYKAQASELGREPTTPIFLARDAYNFWEPLDSQFLDVLTITAHKNDYAVIAPFWSTYFFAYLDYNDPSLLGLTPMEILGRTFSASSRAIQDGQTTGLGDHYQKLIEDDGR